MYSHCTATIRPPNVPSSPPPPVYLVGNVPQRDGAVVITARVTEHFTTVSAMVSPLHKGEPDPTTSAFLAARVQHPVVSLFTGRIIGRPAEHSASGVPHIQAHVIF